MKKVVPFALMFALLISFSDSKAQTRYIDEVFTNVQVDTSIMYAQNYGYYSGFSALDTLLMDVYRPVGDTATNRPLILLSHNGSFLPEIITYDLLSLCFKGREDSSIVELCKRFARRGYVAVSFDYRLGWNATSGVQEVRTATIIQAVYRAMQDSKSLVRYFKNDFAHNSNSYGIDTGKIIIGGSNSGAYVALAASNLDDTADLSDPKFVGSGGPFINQDTMGDFNGFAGLWNYDNYPGISSRFECVLSLGGDVGDTSWIRPGQTPILAFHGVDDAGSPFNTGIVTTSTGQPVIEVSGDGDFMPYVAMYGNNNAFEPNNFQPGPPNINGSGIRTTSIEGLYPFYGQGFEPWNWYDPNCYSTSSNMQALNPGASPAKASLYLDTIMGYAAPRLYKLLIDSSYQQPSGIRETAEEVGLKLFPNPTSSLLNISVLSDQRPISTIQLYDVTGRLVEETINVNSYSKIISVGDMAGGVYLLMLKLADGTTSAQKVIIEK